MNIKGLDLDKAKIRLLNNREDIKIETLENLDVFNKYSWSKFKKGEFFQVISALNYLFDLLDIEENQEFVVFYETDVTEMDAVTVLQKDQEVYFIDIEIKNCDDSTVDLRGNLARQIQNRIDTAMPLLFKDSNFIVVGIANNKLELSCVKRNEDSVSYYNGEDILDVLQDLKYYPQISNFLYSVNNIDAINSMFRKMKEGKYQYYKDTREISSNFKNILEDENNSKVIVCYGNAGSGKSVLALKLFLELQNVKLLVMNPKLYFSLDLNSYYGRGLVSYKPDEMLSLINQNTILIVDEAQRLRIEQIYELTKKAKKTILFGDEKQSFDNSSNLMGCTELANKIRKELSCSVTKKVLSTSKRYSDEVSKMIANLTLPSPKNIENVDDYKIRIYCSEKQFLDQYDRTKGIKKIYIPYTTERKRVFKIDDREFKVVSYTDNDFSIYQSLDDTFIGNTFHALSFDIDHGFVYLPNLEVTKIDGELRIKESTLSNDREQLQKYMNELNVLFTRGRKSLNLYVDNIEVYLYFKARMPK